MNRKQLGSASDAVSAKTVLFSLLAVFVSVALTFGVLWAAEFSLSPDPGLGPDLQTGHEGYTWGHLIENNAYGFRERNFKSPKPSGVCRIMVLGDSLTWGTGLADEERYTAIAEDLLNRTSAETRFEVLNFGLPGIPTVVERDILLAFKDLVDPNLIVVGFYFNDPEPRDMPYSIERENLNRSMTGRAVIRTAGLVRDLGFPHIARGVRRALYKSAERAGVIPVWQDALKRSYEPGSQEWQDFVRALKDIREVSDELGLPRPVFAVLNHSVLLSDFENPRDAAAEAFALSRQAERTARDIGFTTYNHEREIPNRLKGEPMVVNFQDAHPSASVNRVYGEKLYREIADVLGIRH